MLRRNLLRTLLATPLSGWLRMWMPREFGASAIQEPNAAAIYRNVFSWSNRVPSDDWERLRKAATIAIDDPRIVDLLKQARPVLSSMREAARIGHCDWEIETVGVDDIGKGHLDVPNVNLIRLCCLSARRNARLARGRNALDDLFAGLALAHRIGTGGVMIARIVECGGEVPAFETLGRILTDLDRATLDDLSHRLDRLPAPEPASAMIGPESRFILGSLRARLMALGPAIHDQDWADFGFNQEESATMKRLTRGDRTAFLVHLDANGPAFAELARRLDLPRPGCRPSLDEFARAERADHLLVAMLVESAWGVRHMVDRMRALRAMLRAGLALVREGEPAFRAVADPFGDGPFDLERRGKGYRIRSALIDEGKPEVALAVGDAAHAPRTPAA
jgi:hypothetical protein